MEEMEEESLVILSMLRISCSRKEKGPDINGAAKRRRYRQRKVLRNKACLSNETETREDPQSGTKLLSDYGEKFQAEASRWNMDTKTLKSLV